MILVNFEKELPEFTVRAGFMVEEKSTVVLWGESGSGKTTILSCIAGLASPERGEISIAGESVFSSSRLIDLPPQARGIGFVFQHYALFPHLSALENVAFALPKARKPEASDYLERFGIGRLADRKPATLSGGERQRLALARALATEPRVLLLDEPFSALDRRTKEEMYREFQKLREELTMSVILVSHDRREAELLGECLIEVVDGAALE
jgi:molybdate transport system ATP-binding protein